MGSNRSLSASLKAGFISWLFIVITLSGYAAFVPREAALQVAQNLVLERAGISLRGELPTLGSVRTDQAGQRATYYIITLQPAGFVLVAAEDNVYPLLGYSFENDFPTTQVPEHILSWLQGYADQVRYHRDQASPADEVIQDAWTHYTSPVAAAVKGLRSVEPLLVSTWNQNAPYNGLCPADPNGPGGYVYAGCVAIAMAQVMYYYRYPITGTGASSYIHNVYGLQSANYGNTTYRWEEMLNHINTPNTAIAELLYHCGVAVEMMYSPNGSGAYSSDAAAAMRNYFKYSPSTQLVYKQSYSDQAWKDLMRAQLDAGQPMYYHGYGSGGHAFNLDGYQGDDHFHFNWGWGGSFNGYFFLSNLNPGGSTFTNGQGAIINSIPAQNYPYFCGGDHVLTSSAGTFEDGSGPVADYLPSGTCTWLIAPQVNPEDSITSISLRFHRFSTEDGIDKVTIYDGGSTSAPLLGTYSGATLPPVIHSTGNMMYITFSRNDSIEADGFLASYSTVLPIFCNQSIQVMDDSAGIVTDGSGSKNYRDQSICHWIVKPQGATSAALSFTSFDTEPTYDFVEVYEVDPLTYQGTLLGKFSGNNLPPTLISNTGAFFITFFTNGAVSKGGWTAQYSAATVGMEEYQTLPLEVFPVPARDELIVRWPVHGMSEAKIQVRDLNARILPGLRTVYDESGARIDISSLSSGVYFIEARSGSHILQKKFIKQ